MSKLMIVVAVVALTMFIVPSSPAHAVRINVASEAESGPAVVQPVPGEVKDATLSSPAPLVPAGMVLIPAGSFLMGSPMGKGHEKHYEDVEKKGDEHPQHTVHLDAFYMDACEVTNAQYKAFLDATGYNGRKDGDWRYLRHWRRGTYPPGMADHPVVYVGWKNAQAYAKWAGKRLPTEAEWEYACRAGTTTRYNVGEYLTHEDANTHGVLGRDIWAGTSPVGSFPPNAWGLYDMHGNAWEWCADWYAKDYYSNSPDHNPTGPETGSRHVLRGGSWHNFANRHRSANRITNSRDHASPHIGFRCAKDRE